MQSGWSYIILSLALIAFVGFLAYSNTLNSSFHLDDERFITKNQAIKNFVHINKIWRFNPTRFITFFSFSLNYYFGKLNVFGYHLVNLTIHILTSMLVFWFVRLILISPGGKRGADLAYENHSLHYLLIPLFAALLFVSHPINTQAVTYIFQRNASLATFFYILSIALYLKSAIIRNSISPFSTLYWSLSVTAAVFAMFTKEIAFTLPIAIVLVEFFFISSQWEKFKKRLLSFFPCYF